ncbi:MAG: uracil phosphoribosyltransferase [Pseudomonadota bacterium]
MTDSSTDSSLVLIDHPLIAHKLTLMRDKRCSTNDFRRLLREIAMLMGFEMTRHLPLTTRRIETPLEDMDAPILGGRKPAFVSIMRAGAGMTEGLRELIPSAREGHIGLYRDPKTQRPVEYLVKLPQPEGRLFITVDPMLATGYSAAHALSVIKQHGVSDENLKLMVLVAAPEGIDVVTKAHPKITIYAAALDRALNDHAYIMPGLGDAGDRLFGTK